MINPQLPLQYRIYNWKQLTQCKSNTSTQLHIKYTEFLNNDRLTGLRIAVVHDDFGVLFATTLNCSGTIVYDAEYLDVGTFEFPLQEILEELKKWGFNIIYNPAMLLPGKTIELLLAIDRLHFDKIRLLNTWKLVNNVKQFNLKVVAFNVEQNPYWINNGYAPSEQEFLEALNNGSAFNVSALAESRNISWSWLHNWVASIDDILAENAEIKEPGSC